jgi:spermidine/putrescine transport system permease protein
MIGNIIQTSYLENLDYPTASALSAWLLFALLLAIALYARVFGASRIQEYA